MENIWKRYIFEKIWPYFRIFWLVLVKIFGHFRSKNYDFHVFKRKKRFIFDKNPKNASAKKITKKWKHLETIVSPKIKKFRVLKILFSRENLFRFCSSFTISAEIKYTNSSTRWRLFKFKLSIICDIEKMFFFQKFFRPNFLEKLGVLLKNAGFEGFKKMISENPIFGKSGFCSKMAFLFQNELLEKPRIFFELTHESWFHNVG